MQVQETDELRLLAKSERFAVLASFETALLRTHAKEVPIGDFHGDPECAIIDRNEEWCVVGGEGLIVYWLRSPFRPYTRDDPREGRLGFWASRGLRAVLGMRPRRQWDSVGRSRDELWWVDGLQWVDGLEQVSDDHVRVRAGAPDVDHWVNYDLHVPTMRINRLD